MRIVLLFSGGIDSTVLLYHFRHQGHEIHALGIDYGQRHSRELTSAQEICRRIQVPYYQAVVRAPEVFGDECSLLSGNASPVPPATAPQASTVVPGRNLILLSFAAALAKRIGAEAVAYGAHLGDTSTYADCTGTFIEAAGAMLDARGIKLLTPLANRRKAEVIASGQSLRVPFDLTWSCYAGEALPCLVCAPCASAAHR